MADATMGQVIELMSKLRRDELQLLAKIGSGEIDRENLQQMITESSRSPKERLVRTLVRKAEQAIHGQYMPYGGAPKDIFGEICAVYELLGEAHIADKIAYRAENHSDIYLKRIQALCEKNDLERARKLATAMLQSHQKQRAWLAIANESQSEADYNKIEEVNIVDFSIRLGIAQARVKKDGGVMLRQMRDEAEQRKDIGREYWDIVIALIQEYIRQRVFTSARLLISQLDTTALFREQRANCLYALAHASKNSHDVAAYRAFADHMRETGSENYSVYLAHVAQISTQEEDFLACRNAIEHSKNLYLRNELYSALALAYARCGNIPKAREITDTMIVNPREEAKTLAQIARIVYFSQDSE